MTPHLTVAGRESFSAAHNLRDPNLSDEENRDRFGACVRDHGHNYVLEVSVSGEADAHGYVCDLRALGQVMRERVVADVDHRHLNHDVAWLAGKIPSTEVLAMAFWERLVDHIPQCRLERVRVNETEKNFAECTR
jgi:6-pyruvoyltetrahydropterin/6-carboxytetrahydropterin synthase